MKLFVLYIHLLSTCLAVGIIFLTDLQLLRKLVGYRVVIPTPSRCETRVIGLALLALCLTGGLLIYWGLQDRADYLENPKLLVKLALVGVLIANAFVLHYIVFPLLKRNEPLSRWSKTQKNFVALSAALSNSLWLFCALLGIARPWSFKPIVVELILMVVCLWGLTALAFRWVLLLAARDEPTGAPDWIDSIKASLRTNWGELAETQPPGTKKG